MTLRAAVLVCVFIAGCATTNPAAPPPSEVPGTPPPKAEFPALTAPQQFAKLVDEVTASKLAYEPSNATSIGVHDHDGELDDLSEQAIAARVSQLKDQLARLNALNPAELGPDDAIDLSAQQSAVRADLFGFVSTKNHENPLLYASLPGGSVDALVKRDFAPSAKRLASVVKRLQKVPRFYEQAKLHVKSPPKEFTELAIARTKGSVSFFKDSLVTWAKEPLAADPSLKEPFEVANREAIAAIEGYAAWLEKEVLPRSNGKYALRSELFLEKLKLEEQIELPLPELLARGEAQLQKDFDAFVATAKRIDKKKTPAQVMAMSSNAHPPADKLLPSVRDSLEKSRQYLVDKGLITIPSDARPHVEETPLYARAGSFASMDTPGPLETAAKEGFYYVTPVEKEWAAKRKEEHLRMFNPYGTSTINVHEVWPGHFLQFLYAGGQTRTTRKVFWVASNVEGWAHYAEQMMIDEGFGGSDPKYQLSQLQEALLRDVRYVVGIKLHTEGWTVEQGAKLFVEKAFQEPANAYEEARRGAYNPTYLYYTYGKLEIQKLRDEYMQQKKATLREFHDAFCKAGSLPLPLMRKVLLGASK